MEWLRDVTFWEEVVQWALIGYLLTRRYPIQIRRRERENQMKPRDWSNPL